MKKILLHILILFVLASFPFSKVNAESLTSQMIQQEKETFGISSFIDETKKYTNDFFEDMNISDVINSAITGKIDNNKILKKLLKIFGKEIVSSLKTIIAVLVIVLIHSIIKAVADNLETSNISKTIYYVQYILIVTIVMSNFSDLILSITNTIQNLVGFMNSLVPLLITLMIYTGNIATSSLLEPIILIIIEFISNIILTLILPGVSIITALMVVSKLSDKVQIGKLTKFLKSSIVWFLGIILTVFVGVVSLEGTLASSVDGITAKTAKAAVSSMIPVVGKILGDSVDSVLGCGLVLKNALGVVGVIIIIGICATPIIKLSVLTIMYSLSSAIIEPLADEKIVKLLEDFSGIFKLLLGILCAVAVLLIIGTTLVIKISNRIEFLSKWIEGIAIAVIIASIFEMILPNGNIKKYVKVILSIYIVFSIISPFTDNKVKGDFDLSKKVDDYSENITNKNYSKEEISTDKKLNKIYENTFEKELVQTIEKEGFKVYKCNVKGNFNAEEENAGISKISITLESKKILKKKDEENKATKNRWNNESETEVENSLLKEDEIKIRTVDEVKKVEINVGKNKALSSEEDVEAKDIDTLKKFLSKHYEIDKGVFEIHIR